MVVNVSPETEKQLAELAARNGKPVPDFAGSLLEEKLREVQPGDSLNGTDDDIDPDALARAVAQMINRTPEEIAAAQARAIQEFQPENQLPPGQTIFDAVCGKWPGDETDEEVYRALEKLS